ncbi:FAD-binding protein, partial [Streptomyces sp. UNOC14_S4]|nr:FAD-binding protein [Streptomyces sp. UNOC14_S4]
DLTGVRPGEAVGLRGMGLNFFDYMILLTEGRGGRFTRAAPGSDGLVYHRSGREPVLHAGSRRGVPYHARGENQKGPWGRHEPRFLTPDLIGTLRERARCGGTSLEFRRDVWPLITLEVLAVYHAALVAERGSPGDRDRFLRQYLPAVAKDEAAGETVLDDFGIPPGDRWDWERLARPYGGRSFADHAEYRAWLLDHLKADVAEARRGNVDSPLKAAVDVLRDLRNEIRLAVDHSGLTGRSYRDELQGWYTPLNAFLSIGPPARRVAEAVALVEAGVLRVMGPGLRVGTEPGGAGFRLSSDTVPGGAVRAGTLIEARMPEVDIRHTTDPLIGHLMAAGQCLPYRIPDGPGRFHRIGGLTVTGPPYRLVDARGRVHPRRFAFGVPTEGVHWATAAGVRPGVNSVILGDADAIARASLRAAHTPDAAPVPCRNRITWTRRT